MTLKHIFPKTAFFNDFSRQGSKVRDLYNLFYILTILDKVVLQFFQAAKSTGTCYIILTKQAEKLSFEVSYTIQPEKIGFDKLEIPVCSFLQARKQRELEFHNLLKIKHIKYQILLYLK